VKGVLLALQFGGNEAVIERSARESAKAAGDLGQVRAVAPEDDARFWTTVAQFTPRHLEKFREGLVVRISTPLSECGDALEAVEHAGHAHAASGVVRAWFTRADAASRWLNACAKRGWKGVVEFAGEDIDRSRMILWPAPGGDFEIMKGIKRMFDPEGLLNAKRMYNLL